MAINLKKTLETTLKENEIMEAPEKIYLPIYDSLKIYARKDSDEEIEYTRTDVFIEKACEWIKEKWDDNYTMPIIIDSVIKDFKDYIKGE